MKGHTAVLYKKKKECCGCGACADACPAGAIRMVRDREGFSYPKVDSRLCTGCGRCGQVCPLKEDNRETQANAYYGVQAREEQTRRGSSSGGMFPVLAAYVFRQQGVVYGAAFNEKMEVAHRPARNMEELEGLKKTKYVQSSLQGVYKSVKKQLEEDRWVLFCGMPCQVRGLKKFLRKSYPRLILTDLVCYGAPSPGVWRSYVRDVERKRRGRMTDFSFRDKRNRDNGHTCAYVVDGKEFAGDLNRNPYCRMYFTNYIIRPSCHSCRFCSVNRDSDFTMGDYWGIERVRPDLDDGMGTSMVILHTEKAREIWKQVEGELSWFACEEKDVLQPRLTGPTAAGNGRGLFMALYGLLPFSVFRILFTVAVSGGVQLRRLLRR